MLDPKKKQQIIKKFQTHKNDTGSSQVQIAVLTEEIKELTLHLKEHRKDYSSRRGLLHKVNERRRLLRYLQKEDFAAWEDLTKKLRLKIKKEEEKTIDEIDEEEMKAEVEEDAEVEVVAKKEDEE